MIRIMQSQPGTKSHNDPSYSLDLYQFAVVQLSLVTDLDYGDGLLVEVGDPGGVLPGANPTVPLERGCITGHPEPSLG